MTITLFGFVRCKRVNELRPSAPNAQSGRRVADSNEMWALRLERLSRVVESMSDELPQIEAI